VSNGTSGGFDALYSGCKFMTTIVNGAAGNKEGNHAVSLGAPAPSARQRQ
jgi:hypothetical protein